MSWEATRLQRDELYEQVWTTPMRVLAKQYGVSDVALAKICKALGVPRPGRGYWMRKAAGKPVKPTPLPPLQPGMANERRLSRWRDSLDDQELGDDVQTLLDRESDPSMAIVVPDVLHRPHPLVRASVGSLRKHSKSHVAARLEEACLDIRVTRATLGRALLICDALIKALERRGFRVEVTAPVPAGEDRYGSQERLGRLNEQTLVYSLRRPTADGRTELLLTPIELLDLLAQLVTPPRLHKHRYCGVLAPNAALREAVTASAGPAGATLQLLEQARASMGLPATEPAEPETPSPLTNLRRAAARCWALLLVRIYECLPLRCPKCGEPMRIIAFVLDRSVIERILEHIGEPTQPPAVLPARSPPQMEFGFDQTIATDDWPEMDQTAGQGAGGWE